MQSHARDYPYDIADLKEALEEEQTINESLEETFVLELSKIKKSYDITLALANDFETKYEELLVTCAKLLKNFELLKNDSRIILSEPIILTESHEKLKDYNSNELTKLHFPLSINDDACATNSTSCEASILKENIELRAQLDFLTMRSVRRSWSASWPGQFVGGALPWTARVVVGALACSLAGRHPGLLEWLLVGDLANPCSLV
jgi:hypothetical protein